MNPTLLELRGISHSFYKVPVLQGVDFSLNAGEVHSIVGENGAGKSTFLSILAGLRTPDAGTIYFRGKSCHLRSSKEAQHVGISLIHQELQLIPYLDAVQNIFLGDQLTRNGFKQTKAMRSQAQELFSRLGLRLPLQQSIERLSVAQKQMVEIARTLHRKSSVIAMDEPTSALGPADTDHFFKIIRKLRAQGCGIIYVSHRVDEVLAISDRVTVLRDGRLVGTKAATSLDRPQLIEMMVGIRLEMTKKKEQPGRKEILLQAHGLSGPGVQHATFDLRRGEILGFFGLVGAGRSELAYLLAGLAKRKDGALIFCGRDVKWGSCRRAVQKGVVLLPEDRKSQGLISHLDALTNISLPIMQRYCRLKCFLNKKNRQTQITGILKKIRLQPLLPQQEARYFSGGNQQKIVVARWLNTASEVFIFDEPTRGIDIRAKQEIYGIMQDLAASGRAVLMISSEIEEVIQLSDRLVVMAAGRTRAVLEGEEIEEKKIMSYATMAHQDSD